MHVKCFVLKFLKFPSPVRLDARRDRNPEEGCWHRPEEMAGDAAGGTSRERRTR
ncbi:unnamed protein product [Staurois parvus]|uniref:Uncharacterized protein n=1 Tax=Staurois parvus TaxID=386267 RepID=A0ABN9D2I9_9NEOB|nr:unnamed protein product [Staurois parvus]